MDKQAATIIRPQKSTASKQRILRVVLYVTYCLLYSGQGNQSQILETLHLVAVPLDEVVSSLLVDCRGCFREFSALAMVCPLAMNLCVDNRIDLRVLCSTPGMKPLAVLCGQYNGFLW